MCVYVAFTLVSASLWLTVLFRPLKLSHFICRYCILTASHILPMVSSTDVFVSICIYCFFVNRSDHVCDGCWSGEICWWMVRWNMSWLYLVGRLAKHVAGWYWLNALGMLSDAFCLKPSNWEQMCGRYYKYLCVCEVGWLFVGYVWVWWGGAYHPPHTLAIHFIFCQRSLLPVDCVDFVFYTLRAHMWARIVRLISAETIMCTVISVRSGLVNTSRPAHFSRICHLPSTRCLGDCDKSNQFHTVPLNVTFLLDFSCIISNVWVWMLIGETWCLLEQLVFYI